MVYLMDYPIQQNTLRCARTGRELKPGEKVYSVLYDRDGVLQREDISPEAWSGPPAEAFGFWLTRVPDAQAGKRPPADEELLLDCLARLAAETEAAKINFRYVLALYLMRRKRLKFEEVVLEQDQEFLLLRCPRSRALYRVLNPRLTEEQMAEVQDEVARVLGI